MSRDIEIPLLGRHNIENLLAAAAGAHALGLPATSVAPGLASLRGVPGRLERVDDGTRGFRVLVDYAHTDDALRRVLGFLRPVTPGRIVAVAGCGGDRDRTKRPLMTAAVQEFADFAWATADNPRGEQLAQIFTDMKAGVKAPDKITFVEDRRHAISLALDAAKAGDCLLIAGKGHETYQLIGTQTLPFDDREVARAALARRRSARRGGVGA